MKRILLTCALVVGGLSLYAQPDQGNPGGSPTPIDGGISLLIAAGAALGGKKAYEAYKNKEE